MADLKISALPDANALAGGEYLPVVQGGQTRKMEVPADPIIEQSSTAIAFTGGTLDGVTLGGTTKTIGGVYTAEVTIGQADLASAATKTLISSTGTEQYRIRDIFASGAFTNFSGGSGDRDITITDGTSTWSVLPAAQLGALDNARWGDALVPYPAGKNLAQSSAGGTDIHAEYSGGSADYTAGSLVLVIVFERVT